MSRAFGGHLHFARQNTTRPEYGSPKAGGEGGPKARPPEKEPYLPVRSDGDPSWEPGGMRTPKDKQETQYPSWPRLRARTRGCFRTGCGWNIIQTIPEKVATAAAPLIPPATLST